ncbi:MAG: nitroreductase family protein [Actinomycetota bacterium]
MELREAMRHTPSCRYFTDEPVEASLLYRILDDARFASSGGNRQGWRVVVVTDPATKTAVADLHRRQWNPYVANAREGIVGYQGDGSGKRMEAGTNRAATRLDRTDDFSARLHHVPALLVFYVELATLAVTDATLDRQSIVGGGSLYTLVQNVLLGCTAAGLGSALTTLLAAEQPAVDELLGVPDGMALGALVAVGHPDSERQYRKLSRKPVEQIAFADRWGAPFGPVS